MFKIKELHLKGFKNSDKDIFIKFSDAPITIIYGENGSGKTTLLRVIQAFLGVNPNILRKENIKAGKLIFMFENTEYNLVFENETFKYEHGNPEGIEKLRAKLISLCVSVNRANEYNSFSRENILYQLEQLKERLKIELKINTGGKIEGGISFVLEREIKNTIKKFSEQDSSEKIKGENHVFVDNFNIYDAEITLKRLFYEGQKVALENTKNAYFNTIENAIDLTENIVLVENFGQKFFEKKNFFEDFITELPNSKTKEKLELVLKNPKVDLSQETLIFKALLQNIYEVAEKEETENYAFKSLQKLIKIFNEFTNGKKILRLNAVDAFLEFPNEQKHSLSELSSGERHLLTLLTICLLQNYSDVFLIDEPEISLSMKWQRKLLEILHEFAPNAQIIVATHSPDIANGHPEYFMGENSTLL